MQISRRVWQSTPPVIYHADYYLTNREKPRHLRFGRTSASFALRKTNLNFVPTGYFIFSNGTRRRPRSPSSLLPLSARISALFYNCSRKIVNVRGNVLARRIRTRVRSPISVSSVSKSTKKNNVTIAIWKTVGRPTFSLSRIAERSGYFTRSVLGRKRYICAKNLRDREEVVSLNTVLCVSKSILARSDGEPIAAARFLRDTRYNSSDFPAIWDEVLRNRVFVEPITRHRFTDTINDTLVSFLASSV